ncbi:AlpA family transcriptional regulator [Dyella solisilvae]|uniref:AlpA family transcriptional regulator n=1 Tax=Dyella solisilvae TaxID=1920168 RepID=A0A370KA46_9GAMM|nr:AlpA family transcriptional regulator [Dyella solisilvae]RDI99519.1 AlpA family transcriptional regulator [Dyella solisilvae]
MTRPSDFRFVRLAEVCRTAGLSRSQIYRLEAAGQFPKRVKLGQSASAWIESEVLQWCADRIAASREVAA